MREPNCIRQLGNDDHGYALIESLLFAASAFVAITMLALPIFVQERKLLALNQLAFALSRSFDQEPAPVDPQQLIERLKSSTVISSDSLVVTLKCVPTDCSVPLARQFFRLVDGNLLATSFAVND